MHECTIIDIIIFINVIHGHTIKHIIYLLLFQYLVTPADYEPPGFTSASTDNFRFEDEPMNIKVGDVNTVRTRFSGLFT